MSKALTIDLIHMKTKTNRIEQIVTLNVAGLDLDDISIVKNMNKVEVLSLAVNNLASLKDFQGCYSIRELYLRKNKISNLNEVLYL
jgi:Leucine-rich repeat (LRR) protein